MTTLNAVVRAGRVELAEPLDLPDGTELLVAVPEDDPNGPPSPEEIARTLAAFDAAPWPELSEAEWATWQADRAERRQRELAGFDANSERVRRMWE